MTNVTDTTEHASPQHEKATGLRNQFTAQLDNVRADTTLTPEGKQIEIARLWRNTSAQLEALEDTYNGGINTRRTTLEKELFGLPTTAPTADTVSYRDALDRVRNIDTEEKELTDLLRTATLSGD